ncbi:MAG: TRAP transporter large permease subunit [Nitratireductor sp.]|nr:TRAP transporter large permease subunit [Nitratireductor sp.]
MSGQAAFLLLLLPAVLAALLSGMNAFVAIGGVSILVALLASAAGSFDLALLNAVPARLAGILENTVLTAVPLFVAMGALLDRSGVASAMITALTRTASGSARKLSLSILVMSAILAAATGVVGATIVMLATIALPGLLAAGMSRSRAAGLVCASGTLGQIIPPSVLLLLLSDQVSNAWLQSQRQSGNFAADPVTASDLFAAAFMPGLMLVMLYALWVVTNPAFAKARARAGENAPPSPVTTVGPSLLLPVLLPSALATMVLGSILLGIATPTEASSIGACGALLLAMFRGTRPLPATIRVAATDTIRLTGAIFAIVIAASLLSLVFRGLDGDRLIENLVSQLPGGQAGALALVMLAIFVLGFFLEFVEIIFIVIPVAAPALFATGIDPVWFAVLVAMNLQTSFLTPPFGLSLFYFRSAAPQVSTLEIWRGVAPYVLLQLVGLALVAAFPALATWLPGLL